MTAYTDAMRRYIDFEGRASRGAFWGFYAVYMAAVIIVVIIDQSLVPVGSPGSGFLTSIYALVHLLPAMAVLVRRLHDIDFRGWWVFINVTGIGFFVLLVMAALRGTEGPNRFGPDTFDEDVGERISLAPGPGGPDVDLRAHKSLITQRNEPVFGGDEERQLSSYVSPSLGDEPAQIAQPTNDGARSATEVNRSEVARDVIGDLERLAKLHRDGALTDDEYATLKARTLVE